MTTAREYLVGKGLAKEGRGKFSNAAKEELNKAVSSGVKFSDWPKDVKTTTVAKVSYMSKSETVQKSGSGMVEYTFPEEYRFPEKTWEAVSAAPTKGKPDRYTVKEVCNTCRVSLTAHMCDNPSILGGIPVRMVQKK